MKKILIYLAMMILVAYGVTAVACTRDLAGHCTVEANLVLAGEKTFNNVTVDFNAGWILDCNGSTLSSNHTANSKAISMDEWAITIKNCNINQYAFGIRSSYNNANSNIYNCTFDEMSYAGIYYDNGKNGVFVDNVFHNSVRGLDIYSANSPGNNDVHNNIFENISTDSLTIRNNSVAYLNTFWNITEAIEILNTRDVTIHNNTIDNCSSYQCIEIRNTNNTNIIDNTLSDFSRGISINRLSKDILVHQNTLARATSNFDEWNVAIIAEYNTSEVIISDNIITDYGNAGIVVRQSRGYTITGNTISQMSLANKVLYGVDDYWDVPCDIQIVQLFKGFYGITMAGTKENSANFTSQDILISGNTLNGQCRYYAHSPKNLTHDITGWNLTAHELPNLINTTQYIFNPAYSTLQRVQEGVIYSNFAVGHAIDPIHFNNKAKLNKTYSQTQITYTNINDTVTYNVTLYEMSTNFGGSGGYYEVYKNGVLQIQSKLETYTINILPSEIYNFLTSVETAISLNCDSTVGLVIKSMSDVVGWIAIIIIMMIGIILMGLIAYFKGGEIGFNGMVITGMIIAIVALGMIVVIGTLIMNQVGTIC